MKINEIEFIKKTVFELFNFHYEGTISIEDFDGVRVVGDAQGVSIGCNTKCSFARGLFLLAKDLSEGKDRIEIEQKAHFSTCGVMLSLSGGCVLKADSVKKFISYMAACGMNSLLMYMEDIYELENYPYFGYMRGRYSEKELRDIDDFADKLGVEIIPCIQTLGHLKTYLHWAEAGKVRDSAEVMLVGEEKTYEFISDMIKLFSRSFRSRRIHIGMDEAFTMGHGKYAQLHKKVNRKEMFIEHLERVKTLCREEGLRPLIWSDMIFRLCVDGIIEDEYDPKSVITEDIKQAVSDVDIVYWDYYRTEQSAYDSIIKRHQEITPNTFFAGGIWTWDSYLPNFQYTIDTTFPAMRACLSNGVSDVWGTMWDFGDINFFHAIPCLAAFSEFSWRGDNCCEEDVLTTAEFLSGVSREVIYASSEFFLGRDGMVRLGKRFFEADPFYELIRYDVDYSEAIKQYDKAVEVLYRHNGNDFAEYSALCLEIARQKCRLFLWLRSAYNQRDNTRLKQIADEYIPELESLYNKFIAVWEKNVRMTCKPFGMELLQIRLAGIKERLRYARETLCRYYNGEIKCIEELEHPLLSGDNRISLEADAHMKTIYTK